MRQRAHLLLRELGGGPGGVANGRDHQVLEALDVVGVDRLGVDADALDLTGAGCGRGHEAAAGGPGGDLRVKRELEGGWFQWVAMPLPAVLTIQSGINQLRYATLKGIMAAKKKEIRTVAAPPAGDARHAVVALYAPEKSKKTQIIEGSPADAAADLVRRLREEARVIA